MRRFVLGFVALLAGLAPMTLAAETYPTRPVRWVVPYPAGGSTDVTSRILAGPLSSALGQQVVVDNRGGAAGNIGTDLVAESPADGYPFLFTPVSLSINETLYSKLPFNLKQDFVPVVLLAELPNAMVVPAGSPVKTVAEFIALAKAKPGQVNFGSGGTGSSVHAMGELFKLMAGIDIVHVPYKGDGPAMQDLIAGQIQVVFAQLPGAIGHVRGGSLRALAVTSPARSAMLPDVPTIADAGVPGYAATGWYGILAPTGTPPEI